jgi:tetrahydromethanopterin S-methyltransferase subunit A
MDTFSDIDNVMKELSEGITLAKCQQCGCMSDTLKQIEQVIFTLPDNGAIHIRQALPGWTEKMKPIRYSCLGCEHCFAGVAQNAFTTAFPETENQFGLGCEIQTNISGWPPVVGEYILVDQSAPIAVTTLASPDLSKQLADQNIPGLAIVGKLETENIGIDKIIKNIIANPNIRYLVVTGVEPKGHLSGQTMLALVEHGVDENGKVIGSKGKRPILRNVTRDEIETFRTQIKAIDLIGCECTDCVNDKIAELREKSDFVQTEISCGCSDPNCKTSLQITDETPVIVVEENDQPVKLDKAGYFVILPVPERSVIHVEHYNYDNSLEHIIEGTSARDLYLTIIAQNWVLEMTHAAYLGKELAKAEISLSYGLPYKQDAA